VFAGEQKQDAGQLKLMPPRNLKVYQDIIVLTTHNTRGKLIGYIILCMHGVIQEVHAHNIILYYITAYSIENERKEA
jgi:hypothetical protein